MEKELLDAILAELPKSEREAFLAEVRKSQSLVESDIDFMTRNADLGVVELAEMCDHRPD